MLIPACQTRPVLHELKVISFGKTRYKPGCKDRAVDVRARNLHDEYVGKARKADQQYGGVEVGRRGPVESKLLSLGRVKGIVFGNYGEASEATHKLLDTIATSRVRVALPQSAAARRGDSRSEEGEKAVAVTYIRRRVSVAAVKGQCVSLLDLPALHPGALQVCLLHLSCPPSANLLHSRPVSLLNAHLANGPGVGSSDPNPSSVS